MSNPQCWESMTSHWGMLKAKKSDWGLGCVSVHEILNFVYIKLSTAYTYIHLKCVQFFLIIIEHVYMSRQGDQNTLPIVMHPLIPNDIYRNVTILQNLVIVIFPKTCIQAFLQLNLAPSPDSHSEEYATVLMTVLEGRQSATRARSSSNRRSVWSNVITCKIKCHCH